MNQVIWKFPVSITDSQFITVPEGAKFLAFQLQANDMPAIWALVTPDAPKVKVEIRIHGTGHALPLDSNRYEYIDTFQLRELGLVFHAFRVN